MIVGVFAAACLSRQPQPPEADPEHVGTRQPAPVPQFVPDRRPIQIVWTGPQQWTPQQVAKRIGPLLLDRAPIIDDPRGPRFLIHHPASWLPDDPGVEGDATHNMSQYWTLPKATRDAYADAIIEASTRRTFTIGITCHLLMSGPFDRRGRARYFDFNDQADRYAMWDGVIDRWHTLLGKGPASGPGLYEWGLEGGWTMVDPFGGPGGYRTSRALGPWLRDEQGIRPICEAVPVLPDGHTVDVARCQEMAAWCLAREFANGNIAGQSVAECPEVHALLVAQWVQMPGGGGYHYKPTFTVEEIRKLLDRGFIVGGDAAHDALIREAMK
jgi:hypothetical protein